MYDETLFLPSPNLHALFILRHAMSSFATTGILIRQLLDWAFWVEKQGKFIDWPWLLEVLDRFGMMPLYQIFNAICVEDLGFNPELFHTVQFSPFLKERVLQDTLSREFSEKEQGGFIRRFFLSIDDGVQTNGNMNCALMIVDGLLSVLE